MLRKPFVAVAAVSALLFTAPAVARPTGGIWEKAPRIKRVKKPKPAAENEQVQTDTAAATHVTGAQNANTAAATAAVVASSGEVASAANNAEAAPPACTVDRPC